MNNSQKLVDIEFATSQLGGNLELLAKLLDKFCEEFASSPHQVITALAQNNKEDAKLKVHTAKGLSGNLGLSALYECSKILDQQIRVDAVVPAQVEAFTTVMQETIKCIKTLELPAAAPLVYSPANEQGTAAQKEAFLKCLERNEFIDDDKLFSYINGLAFTEAEKKKINVFVEELQYKKAIEMIQGLN